MKLFLKIYNYENIHNKCYACKGTKYLEIYSLDLKPILLAILKCNSCHNTGLPNLNATTITIYSKGLNHVPTSQS